jgi:large subunit ribosomal protein L33
MAPLLLSKMRIVLIMTSQEGQMAKRGTDVRPVVRLRSTAGTGYTYVTRKNRRTDPDRLELRKFDPRVRQHVLFREER